MNIPHATPTIAYRAAKPGSLAATIEAESSEGCRVALLGVPDDTGVRLNAGRPGAVEGPIAFREAMIRGYAADCAGGPLPRVFDAGDVHRAGSLADTHERVTEATAALAGAGLLPVMIGGGHDLTFPFVRAIAQQLDEPMVGVYFDAHLDVRTEEGSGMPFHRLIEGGFARELHVHGLDRFATSAEHLRWFNAHGGRADPFGPDDQWPDGELFVSFDLDVIDQAHAPGVSAPNPCGWSSGLACRWARTAGRCPRVRCFDIMELCPPHDEPQNDPDNGVGRTARLAVRIFAEFLAGVAERRP